MITTLILGAGVSHDYGYPLGDSLLTEIIKSLSTQGEESRFRQALEAIHPRSIDAFLRDRPEFDILAKGKIAEILLKKEKADQLNKNSGHNFYQLVFEKIPLDKYKKFRVISFNYDRSLEFYFSRALQELKQCDCITAFKLLSELKIVHIHGRLSSLPGEDNYKDERTREAMNYGFYEKNLGTDFQVRSLYSPNNSDALSHWAEQQKDTIRIFAKNKFKTVYQNTDKNSEAIAYIHDSSRIFFLGFSYHPLNMQILNFGNNNDYKSKKIHGTAYKMGKIEKKKVLSSYPEITSLFDVDCVTFFKEHFCLEDSQFDEA